MWKGTVVVGRKRVGVKLFAAVVEQNVGFRLLDPKDHAPVRQQMVHPRTGRAVDPEATQRGFEFERGRFVVIDEAELEKLEPKPTRDIEMLRFVPTGTLDHRWYERPYYLAPDAGQQQEYAALAAALTRTKTEGIARWTMRKRDYVGSLRLHAGHLALVALRTADSVVTAADLPAPAGRAFDPRERDLARRLIDALTDTFDHGRFRDEYRDRVLALVAKLRKGETPKLRRFRAKPAGDDSLLSALQRSLRATA
jgi:DNA end-binding protein Ku